MSGGVLMAVGVVGTLALCETVLPRGLAALRKWWRRRALEAAVRSTSTNDVISMSPDSGVGASEKTDIPDRVVEVRRSETEGGPNEVNREANASVRAGSQNAESAYRADDLRSKEELDVEAQRLWDEARVMTHNFLPDWERDREYLAKVYGAARRGHLGAMVKLGEYAYRRMAVVEAYYWTALAELKGATGLDAALREMKTRWLAEGCPQEYDNVYDGFSRTQGSFARALLRIRCAVEAPIARQRMHELADRGCVEAQSFLRTKGGVVTVAHKHQSIPSGNMV